MPNFTDSVGRSGRNLIHDVAALQAAFTLLGNQQGLKLWSGPIDGDWNRHRQSLENAIVRLEQHLNISGGTSSFGGRIDPRSPLAGRLKQMLPMQYQSLAGVKGTACLTITDPNNRSNTGMGAKDTALPDACQRDLDRLMQDGQRNLGLEFVVDCADPDHRGHCCITLKLANENGGVKCLDERLNPLPDHAPLPRPIKDQVSRFAGSASQFHFNTAARGLEFRTRMPVHLREAVVNASRGSPARLSQPFLKGTVGRGSNAREDVALTQAALANIKGPDGQPLWRGGITGTAGAALIEAINAFEISIGQPRTGKIEPGSNAEATLVGLLPDEMKKMRAIPGARQNLIITPQDSSTCENAIQQIDASFSEYSRHTRDVFKQKIRRIYQETGIVVSIQRGKHGGIEAQIPKLTTIS